MNSLSIPWKNMTQHSCVNELQGQEICIGVRVKFEVESQQTIAATLDSYFNSQGVSQVV